MIRLLPRAAACLLLLSAVLPPRAAAASVRPAVPGVVRVNVAGLGTVSARISSTSELAATDEGGAVVYRGSSAVVARRNVYRLRDGIPLPDRRVPPADAEERASRLALVREARVAQAELGPRAIELVPFEVAALRSSDPLGEVVVRADRIRTLRFTATDGALTYNGRAFRGTLDVTTDDEGDMIVVNAVPTARYLASVVGSEIPASWHPEALAAQAIAARTYLATHLRRHLAYDLEGDTRDQQYDGIAGETTATVRAVERTRGLVATYRGAAIEALYSANAGGVTEDSENVFSSALPYLRSVSSPWDEVAASSSWGASSWRWTKEWTAPQLARYMRQRGLDVGDLDRIDLVSLSPTGRVTSARVSGSKRTETIGKDRSRYYFGLLSALFTVEKRSGGDAEVVRYTDTARIAQLEALGAARTATGYSIEWDADHEIATFHLASYVYELPARFVFTGKGFGHGVGLSQWGMQGMALAGASAERILKHYYTGIDLTDAGGA